MLEKDLITVIESEIAEKSLIKHHIETFNNFIGTGIEQIISSVFLLQGFIKNERNDSDDPRDQNITHIHYEVTFNNAFIEKPINNQFLRSNPVLYPNIARLNNLNYSGPLYVDVTINAKAQYINGEFIEKPTEYLKHHKICNIPIMIGSDWCHTVNMTNEEKVFHGEDPHDPCGYFVIKGSEWAISMLENKIFNSPQIYKERHENERVRLEFISKPGDGYEVSGQIVLTLVTNGNIYIGFRSNDQLKNMNIPFYMIFRLLGMTTDKEIVDNIVYGYSTPEKKDVISDYMVQILKRALTTNDAVFAAAKYETDVLAILDILSVKTAEEYSKFSQTKLDVDATALRMRTNLLKLLDTKYLFPHIGTTSETRHKKLRFLGHLIHKLLLVEMGVIAPSDRDSLKNKRIDAAGRSLAKVFKTRFNLAIIEPIRKDLQKSFLNHPFSKVNMANTVESSIKVLDLDKSLIEAIVTGNEEVMIKNRKVVNRIASELLNRKNHLNVVSTLRVIRTHVSTAQKQDIRSDEMRRVHPSYIGYICPIQSADTGETVGLVKQMALGASICEGSSSEFLKLILEKDKDLILLENVFPIDIYENNLTIIKINGYWSSCCEDSGAIRKKYIESRRGYHFENKKWVHRETGIEPTTSIYWDVKANEINFWVDANRLLRPLLVVRNNGELDQIGQDIFKSSYDPFKNTGFYQDILINQNMLDQLNSGELMAADLHKLGIIDYISPEEMENCHIASSYDFLLQYQTDAKKQFTHCDIPVSIMGMPALTCPFSTHNQAPRSTFQTNQGKQTCGYYALNYPDLIDKNTFLQHYCEYPLVSTISSKYTYPNGINAIVAVATFGGYNQEDSLIFNKSSTERGLYEGLHYNFMKVELDKNEKFGKPDITDTVGINPDGNYSLINDDGMIKAGTIVNKNDIIIGKIIQSDVKNDTSIAYPDDKEEARIEKVVRDINQDEQKFCKVKYSNFRPLSIGDKLSSRSAQKSITSVYFNQSNMPFTSSGLVPDLIMNPHAIPSRMTIAQYIEGITAKLAATKGCHFDGTIFNKVDVNSIGDALSRLGYSRNGTERLFNGMTGEWMDAEIFITPTFYQRLQKFVVDDVYSVSKARTNAITRQPADGKRLIGGIKIGEMEKDTLLAHGAPRFLMEKFREDSDAFEIYVCRSCGRRPVVNEKKGIMICKTCNESGLEAEPVKIQSTWTSKLLLQEMEGCNVGIGLGITPYTYEER